jgi:transmembrane sensor
MEEPVDWQVIDRVLAGSATPEEAARARVMAAADPAIGALLSALERERGSNESWDVDAAWRSVAKRRPTRVDFLASTRSPKRIWAWAAAAAILLTTSVITLRRVQTSAPAAQQVLAARGGDPVRTTLSDGSRVVLLPGSALRWQADFGDRMREVRLEGEALFEVTHDARRPFRVIADTRIGGIAEDLGTRFIVRAYPELAYTEVVVLEGRVALHGTASRSVELDPGELGTLGPSGIPTERRTDIGHEPAHAAAGELQTFGGGKLATVLARAARHFDVDIVVQDSSLAQRTVGGTARAARLEELLDALSVAMELRWQRDGRTVTVTPVSR